MDQEGVTRQQVSSHDCKGGWEGGRRGPESWEGSTALKTPFFRSSKVTEFRQRRGANSQPWGRRDKVSVGRMLCASPPSTAPAGAPHQLGSLHPRSAPVALTAVSYPMCIPSGW